ncbi:MAG: ABC transporter substrate-binding protein [Gammaproteobacteria bacterium]|nr:ABC transporter substrate-binding protein [Gammaproteobacteria bacterium]
MHTTRRNFLAGLPLVFLGWIPAIAAHPRVASLDWALAETLLALGHAPVAIIAASDWRRFVIEPALPAAVTDLGLQQEINLELLARLRPDLILTSPFVQSLDDVLPRIAETHSLSIFEPGPVPLEHPRTLMRSIAALLGLEARAEHLLADAERTFDACRARLDRLSLPPLLIVTFIDPRHARVYGGAGIFQNVLDRLGLANAWPGETGYWGFTTTGIERLAIDRRLHLVAIGPVPPDIDNALSKSPLWRRLPFVVAGRTTTLPPVFMFGAMPAALRFAELLTAELEVRYA